MVNSSVHELHRDRWDREHISGKILPQTNSTEMSGGVTHFLSWLESNWLTNNVSFLNALDISCGKGRHTVGLAKHGMTVDGFDFSRSAIRSAKKLAKLEHLEERAKFKVHDATVVWPYKDSTYDIAINSFGLGDVETIEGREFASRETHRVLKPHGLYGIYALSVESQYSEKEIRELRGDREGVVDYGHLFTDDELIGLNPGMILREFTKRPTEIIYCGHTIKSLNYLMIFQKAT